MPTYEQLGFGQGAVAARTDSRAMFGQVMGLVALTCGFAALGAYLERNATGGAGIFLFILAFGCLFGLNAAAARGHEQLAIAILFGFGLLLGMAYSPILVYYAKAEPNVVWQATASTAGFIGILGSYGYATRRDFSSWGRRLFWALLGLIAAGMIAFLIGIPHANVIYCVLGLVVFAFITVFDFNRLARTRNLNAAAPFAAAIFLDIFNVFLLMLNLLGGGNRR